MLSRDADSLYWLSRYVERAENLARVLDVAYRMASMPLSYNGVDSNEWESALVTAGAMEEFQQVYDEVTPENVIEFLAFSETNPSSIQRCFDTARQNARSVRGALTSEMWEAINSAWLDLRGLSGRKIRVQDLPRFLNLVKETSLRYDGSAMRTMLRNDAYWFSRLGVYVERADNTARVLDVKYHVLLPENAEVGGRKCRGRSPLATLRYRAISTISRIAMARRVCRRGLPALLMHASITGPSRISSSTACMSFYRISWRRIIGSGNPSPASICADHAYSNLPRHQLQVQRAGKRSDAT